MCHYILVGFDENQIGYTGVYYISPSEHKVKISRHVQVDESTMYSKEMDNPIAVASLIGSSIDPFKERETGENQNNIDEIMDVVEEFLNREILAASSIQLQAPNLVEEDYNDQDIPLDKYDDILDPDALSVDEQPGAAPEEEGIIPMQIESYEETPWPRRSTRNLFPKYTKEINLHRVFPTSDDDNDIANLDSAMNADAWPSN